MSVLSKSLSGCRSLATNARTNALRAKAAGTLDELISPSIGGGFDSFLKHGRNREQYGLNSGWVYSAIHALALEAAGQPVKVARMEGGRPKEEEARARLSRIKSFVESKMTKTRRPLESGRYWRTIHCRICSSNRTTYRADFSSSIVLSPTSI